MASKNQLLGSGKSFDEIEEVKPVVQLKAPIWLYSESCSEGRVVKFDDTVAALFAAGWVDHPGKVQLLPGHEKVWAESHTAE